MDNRPQGRRKNITGQGKSVEKHGSGLGTGPVGSQGGYSGRPGNQGGAPQQGGGQRSTGTRSGSGGSLLYIIIAAVVLLGGGGGLTSILGGSSSTSSSTATSTTPSYSYSSSAQSSSSSSSGSSSYGSYSQYFDYSSLFGSALSGSTSSTQSSSSSSSGWVQKSNTGVLNTSVDKSARAKRTTIKGNGKDTVTIMVYMCGTDLESKSGMATSDMQEMLSSSIGDNVNLIVYTGGCKQWKNNVVSSSVNQIYQVTSQGLKRLEDNAGTASMTNPTTLASFITYCAENFPANRNELILWDHGGGTLSGYGYDEKNSSSGSMTLQGIQQALKSAGTTFDFIGFDACLMATLENALAISPYADYLIASEETEPGVGWYYTNWLTELSNNTSMSTVEIGKKICDDFVSVCAQKCAGQQTTLSVIDLAELEATIPTAFKDFSKGITELLSNSDYKTVSNARSSVREFASSSKIDQVDLVNLAYNINTDESLELADALLGAIKYNRTSTNMTNAYGISLYFPYQKLSKVDTAAKTYDALGLESEYVSAIQKFASYQTSGQAAAGGTSSPLSTLLGSGSSSYSSYGSSSSSSSSSSAYDSTEMLSELLGSLLSGSYSGISGLTSSNSGYLGRSLDVDQTAAFIQANHIDTNNLVWTESDGVMQMTLSEEQWSLINGLDLNVFYDDGEGYIDLGLDNVYDFTESGALIGEYDGTWLAIDSQPVAYYHIDTTFDGDEYSITGRVPVLLNGDRAELIIVFDNDHPDGYIAGARFDYHDGETETIAKGMTELTEGDTIEFLCDYYSYDGTYEDSYLLGDSMTYYDGMVISNVYLTDSSASNATYLLTDIYGNSYWTPVIK